MGFKDLQVIPVCVCGEKPRLFPLIDGREAFLVLWFCSSINDESSYSSECWSLSWGRSSCLKDNTPPLRSALESLESSHRRVWERGSPEFWV